MPVYNVKDYLVRCINSLLKQEFESYEIIIVDDGSTDGSGEICNRYIENEKVYIIHKENGGLASARNMGLDFSSGEYILFVDSDDWIEQSTLTFLNEEIEKNTYDGTTVDIIKYNYIRHEKGEKLFKSSAPIGIYTQKKIEKLLKLALCDAGKFCLSAWTYIYKSELLKNNNIKFISEREIGSEDYFFNFQVMFHAKKIIVSDKALYHYDCRQGSLTQKYRKNLPEKYTLFYNKLINYTKKIGVYDLYISEISYFYIWTLLYGTCLVNEYLITENHSLKEGRKCVQKYLKYKELKFAEKNCYKDTLSFKQKIQMKAMLWGIEPLFYYLFYIKPQRINRKDY